MVDSTDAELLTAWAQGDDASAEVLVKRHSRELFGFFQGRGARDVDDLMQQTLLDCLDHCRRGATIGNFRALLFAIARRRLVDELRRNGRTPVVEEAGAEDVRDGRTSPSQGIARAQDERVVLEALRRLPLETQILLELFYWRGFTGPDLARAMDLPEGTVRGRLRSARTQLSRSVDAMRSAPIDLHDTLTRLADWKADTTPDP